MSNCINWNGAKSKKGYGVVRLDGKILYVHRMSFRLHNGPIPKGNLVCHRCDNPACYNPEHLFVGTAQRNTDDMKNKGRGLYGRRPVKLKNVKTDEIFNFKTQSEVGAFLNITQSAVSHAIKKGSLLSEVFLATQQ